MSDAFGANKTAVKNALATATAEWMDATRIAPGDTPTVSLTYVPVQDATCTSRNNSVFVNVLPLAGTCRALTSHSVSATQFVVDYNGAV